MTLTSATHREWHVGRIPGIAAALMLVYWQRVEALAAHATAYHQMGAKTMLSSATAMDITVLIGLLMIALKRKSITDIRQRRCKLY